VIAVEEAFGEFMSVRPDHLRRNLSRYRKKIQALGSVKFAISNSPDTELMNALIQLHRGRWAKSGQNGMIEANRSEKFLREAAEMLGSSGLLRIFSLRLADRIVSILLAFTHQATIFPSLSGFDARYERLGLGHELLAHALSYTHEFRYRHWNFLRGSEPYKFDWGARTVAKSRLVILPQDGS